MHGPEVQKSYSRGGQRFPHQTPKFFKLDIAYDQNVLV